MTQRIDRSRYGRIAYAKVDAVFTAAWFPQVEG